MRARMAVVTLVVLGAGLHPGLSVGPAFAQDAGPDMFEPVRAHIRAVMAERDLPSVAVAVSRGTEILWEEGFGYADVGRGVPATPHTPYSLASISKPILATALMTLVEEGRVDLDAPANRYLGWAKIQGPGGDADGATVRRVLSHSAGLPLHYQFFYENEAARPPPRDSTIARYAFTVFPPGQMYEYSNLGFGVLDHLITTVTGEPYAQVVRERVFEPLGMTRSALDRPAGIEDEVAQRYEEDGSLLPFYAFDHPGASAIYCSAHDLVRFGMSHLGFTPDGARPVLSEASLSEMHTSQTPAGGAAYGLGWAIETEYGFAKLSHTGSMPGVSTMLALYPDEGVAIVVLLNVLDRDQRVEIAREIAAVVIDGYAAARAEQAAGRVGGGRGQPGVAGRGRGAGRGARGAGAASVAAGLAGAWTGTLRAWTGDVPLEIHVEPDGSARVRLGDQPETTVQGAALRADAFTGRFAGQIRTPDALRHPDQTIVLDLLLRADTLAGQATAQSNVTPLGYALSSYARLLRVGGDR